MAGWEEREGHAVPAEGREKEVSQAGPSLPNKIRESVLFPLAWMPVLSLCAVGYFLGVKWGILAGWSFLFLLLVLLPGKSRVNAFTLFTGVFLVVAAASLPSLGKSVEVKLPNLLAAAFASYLVMELFLLTEGGSFLLRLGSGWIPRERLETPPVRGALHFLAWAWGGVFALGLAANLGALALDPGMAATFSASASAGLLVVGAVLTPPALGALVRRQERRMVEGAPLWRERMGTRGGALARGQSSQEVYDAVVVGGGLGGLACALQLSKAGLRTVLLEKNRGVGGYCQTFQRDGFPLHAGPTFLGGSLLAWSGWQRWREVLGRLDFRRLEWGLTDGRMALRLGWGARRDYLKLAEKFPRSAEGLKGLFRDLLELREEVREGLSLEMLRPGELTSYREGFRRFPRASRLRHMSFHSFLEGYGLGEELAALLAVLAEGWGSPSDRLPALTGCILLSDLLINGIYAPTGGFSRLAAEMARLTEKSGGKVLVEAPVDQVKPGGEGKVPYRVRFRGGELETRTVIFDLDPRRIPGTLIPASLFEEGYREALASLKPSCTFFSLHLIYPEDLRLPDRVFLAPSRPKRIRLGDTGHEVRLVFMAKDPHPGGAGCSLLLRTPLPASSFHLFQEDRDLASELSALLKEELFSIHPSAKGYIREFTTTPVHYSSLSGASQGSCFGFEPTLGRWPFDLPGPSLPPPGTFLAGAWGACGGGVAGALLAGEAAARRVLSFLGREQGKGPEEGGPEEAFALARQEP